MPTCPQCGSTDAFKISPNYFRCAGMVPPFADAEPGEYVQCAHEYQEGASLMTSQQPVCDCATFAIGRCHTCEKWVCGEHSAMFEGRRLCLEHHREALAPQQAREAERKKEQEAIWRQKATEREETGRRQEEELERRRRRRNRADAVQGLALVAIVAVAFLYLDGRGMSGPLNLILTGALAGFLTVAASIAYSGHSYYGDPERHLNWEFDSFWIGLLGLPLGAAAGGILALVV